MGWDPKAEGCGAGSALPITSSFGMEPRCRQRDPPGPPALMWPCEDGEQRGSVPTSSPAEHQQSWLCCGYRNSTSPLLAGAPGSPREDLAAQEFGSCLKSRRNEGRLRSVAVMEAQPRHGSLQHPTHGAGSKLGAVAVGYHPLLYGDTAGAPQDPLTPLTPFPPPPPPWLGVTFVASFGMRQKTPQHSLPHLRFIVLPAPKRGLFLAREGGGVGGRDEADY